MANLSLGVVAGVLALTAAMAALWAWRRHRRWRSRVVWEDALKILLTCQEQGDACTPETLAARLHLSLSQALKLTQALAQRGLVHLRGQHLRLTPQGRALALHLVRAHRLWERYLSDYTELPLAQIHRHADRMEHHLSPQQVRRLAAALGHPRHDPHGDPIPYDDADLAAPGVPLTEWPAGRPARITHIEDEPEAILEQLLAEDLLPGTVVEVLESTPEGVHLRLPLEDRELWLATVVASRVHVAPWEPDPNAQPAMTLDQVPLRTRVRVVRLSPRLRGLLRRRLLDLGFTPGAIVEPVMASSFGRGDPRAYRVRGTLIALRQEQARHIWVEPVPAPSPQPPERHQEEVSHEARA